MNVSTLSQNSNGKLSVLVNWDQIPAELDRPGSQHWVNWRYEKAEPKNGKPPKKPYTKVPYSPKNLRRAATTRSYSWSTLATARMRHERDSHFGIGIVLQGDLVGVDLDGCRDAQTGCIEDWARGMISLFNSYTEVSPSGTGIRILVRGKVPEGGYRRGKVEIYDKGSPRYLTITGHRVEGTPEMIAERQAEIDSFHAQHIASGDPTEEFEPKGPVEPHAIDTTSTDEDPASAEVGDDDYLLELAKEASNGSKFSRLWAGDLADHDDDHSRADHALCSMLAFWAGHDPERIDRLFRLSGLYRDKWDREDYRDRTITRCLKGDVFNWAGHWATIRGEEVERTIDAIPEYSVDGGSASLAASSRRRRGYKISELGSLPPLKWHIDQHFSESSCVAIVGPSGCGKTFIALDMALSVARGTPYLGTYEATQGAVLYIVAEGFGGLQKRLKAWQHHHGIDEMPENIIFIPDGFDLQAEGDEELDEIIDTAKEQLGELPKLIVVDTLNRNFGVGDENSTNDMRSFTRNCDSLRKRCKATVLVIHHTGKDPSRKERGSIVLRTDFDTLLLLDDTDGKKATLVACEKQKDFEPFEPYKLVKTKVVLSEDDETLNSIVLVQEGNVFKTRYQLLHKTKKDLLGELIRRFPSKPFTFTEGLDGSSLKRDTYRRTLKELVEKKFIKQDGDYTINPDAVTVTFTV